MSSDEAQSKHRVCPWWIGYVLLNPLRRLRENPQALLGPHVKQGMTAVDIGCAMGFFSLPLARMVGPQGRVVCLDLQERMLSALQRRARRRGLDAIIEARLCTQEGLGIEDLAAEADLVVAFYVVHEAIHTGTFIAQCAAALRPGGKLLIAEPGGHVDSEEFEATLAHALDCGLRALDPPRIKKAFTALLEKPLSEEAGGGVC